MTIDRDVRDYFLNLAREKGISFGELLARGVGVIHVAREQRKLGRNHLGFVSDPAKLDAEIIGI